MNTKHFYNGKKICLSKEDITEVLYDCQSLNSIVYELAKLKGINTVYGSSIKDLRNEEIFEYDIIYNKEDNNLYYVKFKNGSFLAYLLPFGTDNKGKLLTSMNKEKIIVLFNSYEIDNYDNEIKEMLFNINNKKLDIDKLKKYFSVLELI